MPNSSKRIESVDAKSVHDFICIGSTNDIEGISSNRPASPHTRSAGSPPVGQVAGAVTEVHNRYLIGLSVVPGVVDASHWNVTGSVVCADAIVAIARMAKTIKNRRFISFSFSLLFY